jgi:histidinol-phosphate/aromatic aminotransferase/cobyric acid decarboxylase-like protein
VAPVEPVNGSGPDVPLAPAGAHGGDGPAVAASLGIDQDAVLDLSQSLNPVAPDPVPAVARHLNSIRRYPDPRPAHRSLAAIMGVEGDRLLLTNGGAEAISLVAAELGGRVVEPEFALHPRGSGVMWRSNPHNPSGLLAAAADTADVWDEAFFPLATGRWTRGDAGAVVVGSLTKLLACPGLRLGYVLADPDLVDRCRRRQPTWAVNSLAVSVLPELLDAVDLSGWSKSVSILRRQLIEALHAHGLKTQPSDAPWVLVERGDLRKVLAPHGIVVRDCSSFGMPEVSRVAVPSADGLGRLGAALDHADLDRQSPPPPRPGRRTATASGPQPRVHRR